MTDYALRTGTNELAKETDPLGHSTSYEYKEVFRRMTKHDGELHTATRGDAQGCESRAVRWLWGAFGALAVMFAAGILRADVLVHGNAFGHVLKDIEIAAIVVSIGALFRWAVLHERAKRLKLPGDER